MNDKELLELAAKAAGLMVKWSDVCHRFEQFSRGKYVGKWDPLTDDGDALRLAVRLSMAVDTSGVWVVVKVASVTVYEDARHETLAATRRAIVRAAAAIGEKL